MTIYEAYDLHPRAAYHLKQRGLLFVNEYKYAPYRLEPGGSIDFVAVDPKDGQFFIIECKLKVRDVEALEDQLYKYYHAFYVLDAIKEVYTFEVTDDQKTWLESRKIGVHVLSMDTPTASVSTSVDDWEYFQVIFDYWNIAGLLPLQKPIPDRMISMMRRPWEYSNYRGGLAKYYREWLGHDKTGFDPWNCERLPYGIPRPVSKE